MAKKKFRVHHKDFDVDDETAKPLHIHFNIEQFKKLKNEFLQFPFKSIAIDSLYDSVKSLIDVVLFMGNDIKILKNYNFKKNSIYKKDCLDIVEYKLPIAKKTLSPFSKKPILFSPLSKDEHNSDLLDIFMVNEKITYFSIRYMTQVIRDYPKVFDSSVNFKITFALYDNGAIIEFSDEPENDNKSEKKSIIVENNFIDAANALNFHVENFIQESRKPNLLKQINEGKSPFRNTNIFFSENKFYLIKDNSPESWKEDAFISDINKVKVSLLNTKISA